MKLVKYEAARKALIEAKRVDEVKEIRDKAIAMKAYATQAKDRELIDLSTDIRMRAERRAGQMLTEMKAKGERAKAGDNQHSGSSGVRLPELGVTKTQSSRWQRLAEMTQEDFEERLTKAKVMATAAIDSSVRDMIAAEQRAKNAKLANGISYPEGKYGTIIIDPPWEIKKIERDLRPNQVEFDYPTMNLHELTDFNVEGMALPDCHLFCWTTQKWLPHAIALLPQWGFIYVLTMVWHKGGGFQPIGLPQYNCEFALYARRGNPQFVDTKAFSCCFTAPRREHSRKPDEFYDLIRRVTAEPRIDVFSREKRAGYAQYGNQVSTFVATGQGMVGLENTESQGKDWALLTENLVA